MTLLNGRACRRPLAVIGRLKDPEAMATGLPGFITNGVLARNLSDHSSSYVSVIGGFSNLMRVISVDELDFRIKPLNQLELKQMVDEDYISIPIPIKA